MRIALCISGQPRGLPVNIPLLEAGLINPSGITDVFIHTWFDESMVGQPFLTAQPTQHGTLGVWRADTIELLNELNPKKLMHEAPRNFAEFSDLQSLDSAIQPRLASNFYSVHMANNLRKEYEAEHNFAYDLVVRARVDCIYDKAYDVREFLAPDWRDVVHVSHTHQHMRENYYYPTANGSNYLALSDTFAYGSPSVMDKFCDVFPNMKSIYSQIVPYQYGEAYLGYHVRHTHQLPVSMQPIQYHLNRA